MIKSRFRRFVPLLVLCLALAGNARSQTPAAPSGADDATPAQTAREKKAAEALKKSVLDQGLGRTQPCLGEVVVTATRTPQDKEKTAASVSVYTMDDIETGNLSTPEELIRDDVGVSGSRSVGGGGMTLRTSTGVQDYNIRGLDGNRVLLLEDGIRAPDIFTFQGNAAYGRDVYDFDSLKQVEILKSAGSALYGGGAIGGVVSYATKDPGDYLTPGGKPWYVGYKEGFDSSDLSFSETSTFAARTGQVEYLGIYTRRDGQQQDAQASATYGPAGPNPVDWYSNNFLGKVVYHVDGQNQLRLTGEYFNSHDDTDVKSATFPVTFGPGFTVPYISGLNTQDEQDRSRVSLDYRFDGKEGVDLFKNIQAQVYWQESRATQGSQQLEAGAAAAFFSPFQPAGDPATIDRSEVYKTDILGASLQATHDVSLYGLHHEWTYGADLSYATTDRRVNGVATDLLDGSTLDTDGTETYPRQEIPKSYTTRLGAFAQDQIKPEDVKWLTLTPALRVDYYHLDASNSPAYLEASHGVPAVSYSKPSITPSFSALGQATKEVAVYGNFAMGFRNPNTEDLNATFTNFGNNYEVIPNPDLKPEKSYDFELGVRGDYEPVKFSLATFYNYYQNFIDDQAKTTLTDPALPGFSVYQSQNIKTAEIHGVEGHLELPLGYYAPALEGFKIVNAAAWTHGEDLEHHGSLRSIDPFKVVNTLRYEAPGKKWGVDLVGTWVAEQENQPVSGALPFTPPAYYTVDLVGKYRFNDHALLTLGVYNLTNQTYFLYQNLAMSETSSTFDGGGVGRYAEPGLTVRAGLSLRF